MPSQPRIVRDCPSVENTVFVESFQSQYPARYSSEDDDKHVLHAGGEGFLVEFDSSKVAYIDPVVLEVFRLSVTLFVLNSTFVICSMSDSVGIEIPYTLIALHALKESRGRPALYLQLLPCSLFTLSGDPEYVDTLDILIQRPEESERQAGAQAESQFSPLVDGRHRCPNSLFTKSFTMQDVYNALSTCSALHYDSETESSGFDSPSSWITKESGNQTELSVQWINSGVADDLGMDAHLESGEINDDYEAYEAGMNIDVGETAVIGIRRKNSDSLNTEASKARRRVA